MRKELNHLGYPIGEALDIDGLLGAISDEAIKQFKKRYQIVFIVIVLKGFKARSIGGKNGFLLLAKGVLRGIG